MGAAVATVADVLTALDKVCAGRLIKRSEDAFGTGNPFVVVKTSHLPGKAVAETPGLVVGDPARPVRKIAVCMTLTESQIELAGATGVDAIVCHHPVADAASSGGVPLRGYAGLYHLAVFEAHEAFHGRHPGIAFIHGHTPFRVEIAYGGLAGNIVFVGNAREDVHTVGDILDRLGRFCDLEKEAGMLEVERRERNCADIHETCMAVPAQILCGRREAPVKQVVHFFPHTGFTPEHLRQVKREHPEIDTAIVSISRVKMDNPLVQTAQELGLNDDRRQLPRPGDPGERLAAGLRAPGAAPGGGGPPFPRTRDQSADREGGIRDRAPVRAGHGGAPAEVSCGRTLDAKAAHRFRPVRRFCVENEESVYSMKMVTMMTPTMPASGGDEVAPGELDRVDAGDGRGRDDGPGDDGAAADEDGEELPQRGQGRQIAGSVAVPRAWASVPTSGRPEKPGAVQPGDAARRRPARWPPGSRSGDGLGQRLPEVEEQPLGPFAEDRVGRARATP